MTNKLFVLSGSVLIILAGVNWGVGQELSASQPSASTADDLKAAHAGDSAATYRLGEACAEGRFERPEQHACDRHLL